MSAVSAYLITMCWAAQGCPASTAGGALRADSSHEPDRYVQPVEDGGIIDFLTSAQMILGLVVGLIAVTMLVVQLWAGRRDKALEEGEHEERG
ncbi:hypothetical protein H1V43_23520 [Streptomyces sp. PSKA54]|uniref:Uncharacterized protein n=1 Tax=Streptomyces himalayensis subsp. aureolus TaxID=2758039 RepID=A0A7W2HHQ9_9ACTN|nr:hypothetical protein [Streptomyces himalayensis]MBA4864270.1 hypothetical protein [Streptomyces himalayensis subsp. aureolus]